ncbi:MAG: hypothetical protein KDC35_09285 [Acidobacteria bacterium]|nr:hypothetical protein [Acidobacteriota bacterium]
MKHLLCLVFMVNVAQPLMAQVDNISFFGTINNVGVLNWPNGTWYVSAILVDDMGNEIAPLSNQVTFMLTDTWPSITVTMTATAPITYFLRFYRDESGGLWLR